MEIFIYLKSKIFQFGKNVIAFALKLSSLSLSPYLEKKKMVWFHQHNFFSAFHLPAQSIQEEWKNAYLSRFIYTLPVSVFLDKAFISSFLHLATSSTLLM